MNFTSKLKHIDYQCFLDSKTTQKPNKNTRLYTLFYY
nr:MAG TPA: hypothetical protein [Caudoviricetes sp.]